MLAVAATLILMCGSTITWLVWGPHQDPAGERAARPADVSLAPGSDQAYAEALAALRREVHGNLTADPRVLDVIEENLAVIDIAITEYRLALTQAPGDPDLGRRLEAARQRKLAVLRQAATLAPAGTD